MGHPVLYKGTNLFGAELLPPDSRPLPELVPLRVAVTQRRVNVVGGGPGDGRSHQVILVVVGALASADGPVQGRHVGIIFNILALFLKSYS